MELLIPPIVPTLTSSFLFFSSRKNVVRSLQSVVLLTRSFNRSEEIPRLDLVLVRTSCCSRSQNIQRPYIIYGTTSITKIIIGESLITKIPSKDAIKRLYYNVWKQGSLDSLCREETPPAVCDVIKFILNSRRRMRANKEGRESENNWSPRS